MNKFLLKLLVAIVPLAICYPTYAVESVYVFKNIKFIFKIKTKNGQRIGGILIEAADRYEAEVKLKKQYPDCIIEGCKEQ